MFDVAVFEGKENMFFKRKLFRRILILIVRKSVHNIFKDIPDHVCYFKFRKIFEICSVIGQFTGQVSHSHKI